MIYLITCNKLQALEKTELRTQVSSDDPDQKMPRQWPQLKFDFEGGIF